MFKSKLHRRGIACLCVLCFGIGLAVTPPPSRAFDLGDILKGGGIAFVVTKFGNDIDHFINSALSQRDIERGGMTKVVPVVRVGNGTAVGAVQVVGPEQQVRQVQAVAEVEIDLGRSVRGRALIPVTTKKVYTSTVKGVGGVGVSANIHFPL